MPTLDIIGGSYEGRSVNFSGRRCVNWMPVLVPESEGPKYVSQLWPTSGLRAFKSIANIKKVQGMCFHNDVLYIVADNTFYSCTYGGQPEAIGSIPDLGKQRIDLVYGGEPINPYIMICNGTWSYYHSILETPKQIHLITDTEFRGADRGFFSDGRFFGVYGGLLSYSAALNTPATWSSATGGGAFESSYQGDLIRNAIVIYEEILSLGDNTSEIYYNDGVTPFARRQATSLTTGIAAPESLISFGDMAVWLGKTKNGQYSIMQRTRDQIQPLSTSGIHTKFNKKGFIVRDAFAMQYEDNGQQIYHLTFPSENLTLCVAMESGIFFEKSSRSLTPNDDYTPNLIGHRANCAVKAWDMTLIGDRESGNIFILDRDYYSDNGTPIERVLQTSSTTSEQAALTFDELILDCNLGENINEENPILMYEFSKNGGHNWGTKYFKRLPQSGHYGEECKLTGLGTSINWATRLTVCGDFGPILTKVTVSGYAAVTVGGQPGG